jgi:hypothetical protein
MKIEVEKCIEKIVNIDFSYETGRRNYLLPKEKFYKIKDEYDEISPFTGNNQLSPLVKETEGQLEARLKQIGKRKVFWIMHFTHYPEGPPFNRENESRYPGIFKRYEDMIEDNMLVLKEEADGNIKILIIPENPKALLIGKQFEEVWAVCVSSYHINAYYYRDLWIIAPWNNSMGYRIITTFTALGEYRGEWEYTVGPEIDVEDLGELIEVKKYTRPDVIKGDSYDQQHWDSLEEFEVSRGMGKLSYDLY